MKKNKRGILIVGCFVIVVLILSSVYLFTRYLGKITEKSTVSNQKTVKVIRMPIKEKLVLRGIVRAEEKAIYSLVSGIVRKVYVCEGDYVKKGKQLVYIDSSNKVFELKKKEKELEKLSNEIKKLQEKLEKCKFRTSFDGQVQEVYVTEGESVSLGSNLFKIVSDKSLFLTVAFPSWLFKSIRVGQKLKVVLTEYDIETEGSVDAKSSVFYINDNGQSVFDVKIVVDNEGKSLPSGAKAFCVMTSGNFYQEVRSVNEGILKMDEIVIKSEVEGRIKKIFVKQYDRIKKGDILIEFFDQDIREQIDVKKDQIYETKEAIENLKKEINNCKVISPVNGVISNLNVSEGKLINMGDSICSIWSPNDLIFESKISEYDVYKVKKGDRVKLNFTPHSSYIPESELDGVVESINPRPLDEDLSQNISWFNIKVRFHDENIKRGTHATAEIEVIRKKDALCIPIEAVRKEGDKYFVYVKKFNNESLNKIKEDGEISDELGTKESYYVGCEKREVKLGISNEHYVEILEGLKEGEEVVLPQAYKTTH
ncbi:efflux RND transporter periplasmic adaptor subunit [Caldicellulosiruptor acetigenus]|uniref:efflux RND transporter periplasmic adaptor subunit n=1 Tax=Caldicellulosiruptor acetigenus TaxID=301953 RepID=UPI00031D9E43|nr:efflux RND transporter periplasmic adaptor subunit [Caldicellulosiruptor acetigenus]